MKKFKIIALTLSCVFGLNCVAQATNQQKTKQCLVKLLKEEIKKEKKLQTKIEKTKNKKNFYLEKLKQKKIEIEKEKNKEKIGKKYKNQLEKEGELELEKKFMEEIKEEKKLQAEIEKTKNKKFYLEKLSQAEIEKEKKFKRKSQNQFEKEVEEDIRKEVEKDIRKEVEKDIRKEGEKFKRKCQNQFEKEVEEDIKKAEEEFNREVEKDYEEDYNENHIIIPLHPPVAYIEEKINTTNHNCNNQENFSLNKKISDKRANRNMQLNNSQSFSDEDSEEINIENLNELSEKELAHLLFETDAKLKEYEFKLKQFDKNQLEEFGKDDPEKRNYYVSRILKYSSINSLIEEIWSYVTNNSRNNNDSYSPEKDNKDEINTTNQNRNNQENLSLNKEKFAKRANRIKQLNNDLASSEEDVKEEIFTTNLKNNNNKIVNFKDKNLAPSKEDLEKVDLKNLNKLSDNQSNNLLEQNDNNNSHYSNITSEEYSNIIDLNIPANLSVYFDDDVDFMQDIANGNLFNGGIGKS